MCNATGFALASEIWSYQDEVPGKTVARFLMWNALSFAVPNVIIDKASISLLKSQPWYHPGRSLTLPFLMKRPLTRHCVVKSRASRMLLLNSTAHIPPPMVTSSAVPS
jgi:hypothetical protein